MNTKNTNLKHRRRQRFPAFHLVLQFMLHTLLFHDILFFFSISFDVINTNAFFNLMNHMKQVFLVAHLRSCSFEEPRMYFYFLHLIPQVVSGNV